MRESLREIAIVVIGVVIAVLLGQAVDQLHWANEVRTARASLAGEIGRADLNFAYRVAAQPCIGRRLDALETVIERVSSKAPVPRLGPIMPDIGNGLNDNIWETYRAAQTLAHFDDHELTLLGRYYLLMRNVQNFMNQEEDALGVLKVLQGDPSRLGPADIAGLRVALQHARFDNFIISDIAAYQLDTSRALHIGVPAPDASRLKEVCGPLPVLAD